MIDIDKIILEWSYRIEDGIPDLADPYKVQKLREAFKSLGYSDEFISSYLQSINEGKGGADVKLVKDLGGEGLSNDIINDIIAGKYEEKPLKAGSGNTYSTKNDWSYKDLQDALVKEKELTITYASKTKKVRGRYERICQFSRDSKTDLSLGRIYTLYKLSKLNGVKLIKKNAPGIKHEKMQINNLADHLKTYINKNSPGLDLYIDGKSTGVKINSGIKVDGSPKADLALGLKEKGNFYISYKHGKMYDSSGNPLPASFQQYGSIKSFYNKKFTDQVAAQSGMKDVFDIFIEKVKNKVKTDGKVYKNVTKVHYDETSKLWIVTEGKIPTVPKDQDDQIWKKNLPAIKKRLPIKNLYVLEGNSSWSKRESLLKMKQIGKDIAMMSIFGNDYFSGTPGINNCNILMQDHQAFTFGIGFDKSTGDPNVCNIDVSSAGHIIWNPKIYGNEPKFPKFDSGYEPYLLARKTGESKMDVSDGFMIGVRLLIMPKSQTKSGTDI